MTPTGREDSGARAVLGREKGDDLAEDGVGEVADAVGAFLVVSGRRLLALGGER